MRAVLACFCLLLSCACLSAQEEAVTAVFWNLENWFDYRDGGGGEADREFSPAGERHWTRKRFEAKARSVAKSVLYLADRSGGLPDMIGVAEIENRFVLKKLLETDALCKTDYQIVHFDSGDPRGIDVALLYRASSFRLIDAEPLPVRDGDGLLVGTRDILHATLERSGRRWHFLVCHLPSKYGGARASAPRRQAAVACLKAVTDTLAARGEDNIIVMGDFNDTPENAVFAPLSGHLDNLALPLYRRGEGTIRFEGRWELIDQAWVSRPLSGGSHLEAVRIPFLMMQDSSHPGEKPRRTYSGPRYIGGVSDHLPILLKIVGNPEENPYL